MFREFIHKDLVTEKMLKDLNCIHTDPKTYVDYCLENGSYSSENKDEVVIIEVDSLSVFKELKSKINKA